MDITNQQQLQKKDEAILQVKKTTMWAFLSVILFKIALDLSYCFVVSRAWAYWRFDLQPDAIKIAESYLLLTFIFVLIPKSAGKLSNVLLWLLILMSYVPMLTFFAFADESRIFTYTATVFWATVIFLVRMPMPDISLSPLKQAQTVLYALFICLWFASFLLVYYFRGLSFSLDPAKAYAIRSEYVATGIPFATYIFNWTACIVNPIAFVLFINGRKWFPALLIILLQGLIFSAVGFRIYLFALPFALVLMWVVKRRNPIAYLGIGLCGAVLIGILSYYLIGDKWISAFVANRLLIGPAQLAFYYYDFFSQNEPVLLSHSIFRFFLNYPYHVPPPYLIGELYYNEPGMEANTGIVSDAFMNSRFLGLALWATLLFIVLKLLDSCSNKKDFTVAVAAIAVPAITLTNGGLLTNFLTNGLLLALLLLYLLPRKLPKTP